MSFWVYILKCADDSYYTGHTDDLERRIPQHYAGLIRGCYTLSRRPLSLVYAQDFDSREEALGAEQQIERWSRGKKQALAALDFDRLKMLAMNRLSRASIHGSTGSPRTGCGAPLESGSAGSPETIGGATSECSSTGSTRTNSSALEGSGSTSSPRTVAVVLEGGLANQRSTAIQANATSDYVWMHHALALADHAEREEGEIPVGALVVNADGELVGEGWNRNIGEHDPTAHAEIVAMRQAGKRLGNHRLIGCTLYVTLEPCAMCAMAMVHARITRVVFAAHDPKTGAAGSVFDLLNDPRHNHHIEVQGGVLAEEAGAKLRNYFRRKRMKSAKA